MWIHFSFGIKLTGDKIPDEKERPASKRLPRPSSTPAALLISPRSAYGPSGASATYAKIPVPPHLQAPAALAAVGPRSALVHVENHSTISRRGQGMARQNGSTALGAEVMHGCQSVSLCGQSLMKCTKRRPGMNVTSRATHRPSAGPTGKFPLQPPPSGWGTPKQVAPGR